MINRIIRRLRGEVGKLQRYYVFESWGVPPVHNDRISKSLLRKWAPDHPVIVECGAHDGGDSVELARLLRAQVYAFEPVPELYERLCKRTKNVRSIHCVPIALGAEVGNTTFHVSSGASDGSSSLMKPKEHLADHPRVFFNESIEVKVSTLDHWAAENNIERVDVLWLDMQGSELDMLRASPNVLANVTVIHTEVSVKETYAGVPQYPEVRSFLEAAGFDVVCEAIPDDYDMGNVLFARKDRRDVGPESPSSHQQAVDED